MIVESLRLSTRVRKLAHSMQRCAYSLDVECRRRSIPTFKWLNLRLSFLLSNWIWVCWLYRGSWDPNISLSAIVLPLTCRSLSTFDPNQSLMIIRNSLKLCLCSSSTQISNWMLLSRQSSLSRMSDTWKGRTWLRWKLMRISLIWVRTMKKRLFSAIKTSLKGID